MSKASSNLKFVEDINQQLTLWKTNRFTYIIRKATPGYDDLITIAEYEPIKRILILFSTRKWVKGIKRTFTINKAAVDFLHDKPQYGLDAICIKYQNQRNEHDTAIYRIRYTKLMDMSWTKNGNTGYQGLQYEIYEDCLPRSD